MQSVSRRRFMQGAVAGCAAGPNSPSSPGSGHPPRKYRLGLVTYNLAATWDLATILRVCGNVGISPVELRTTHKHGVEPSLSKVQRQEIRKRFADAGIEFWGCGTICEFHEPDSAVVARNIEICKSFVGLVAELGGQGVKVRPNGLPRNVPVNQTLAQIGQSLLACGKAAAEAGIEIWVEVHGTGTSQPKHILKIMQECGHPRVGLTWNSNGTDIKNGSVADAFRMLRPWIRSCHINELYKQSRGVYPYRELFRLLRETGYDRVTLIEVGKTSPDSSAGEELMQYYKALWEELSS